MNRNLRYTTRFREDANSNIEILKDALIRNFTYFPFDSYLEDALDQSNNREFIETNSNGVSSQVMINPPAFLEIGKFPKNKDTAKLMQNAIDAYFETAIDGIWEKKDAYSRELNQLGISSKSDLDTDAVIELAKIFDKSAPWNFIATTFIYDAPYEFTDYYNVKIEASFRTFRGTDSVDLILNMYIVDEYENIIIDSYEPVIFGFTTNIIEGRDKDGSIDDYIESMLEDLVGQF